MIRTGGLRTWKPKEDPKGKQLNLGSHDSCGEAFLKFIEVHRFTWNPNDPCFCWKGPCFGGLKPKNRGQRGSRQVVKCFQGGRPLTSFVFKLGFKRTRMDP